MRLVVVATLVCGMAMTGPGCGSECERAVDRKLECMAAGKRKTRIESKKTAAVQMCEADPNHPVIKLLLECGRKSTCEEVVACRQEARRAQAVKPITKYLDNGDIFHASELCLRGLRSYRAGGAFKVACDTAFDAIAKKPDDYMLIHIKHLCMKDDGAAWKKASASLKKTCIAIGAAMKKRLENPNNATFSDFECGDYKRLVAMTTPEHKAAAEKFCEDGKRAAESHRAVPK